jgi:hypothetical protein
MIFPYIELYQKEGILNFRLQIPLYRNINFADFIP